MSDEAIFEATCIAEGVKQLWVCGNKRDLNGCFYYSSNRFSNVIQVRDTDQKVLQELSVDDYVNLLDIAKCKKTHWPSLIRPDGPYRTQFALDNQLYHAPSHPFFRALGVSFFYLYPDEKFPAYSRRVLFHPNLAFQQQTLWEIAGFEEELEMRREWVSSMAQIKNV